MRDRNFAPFGLLILSLIALSGCNHAPQKNTPPARSHAPKAYHQATLRHYKIKGVTYHPAVPKIGTKQTGIASWYGYESPNRITANGEPFKPHTSRDAAHKTWPLPSLVRVKNLKNGRTIIVRLNDRGPFSHGRVIDLTKASAEALDIKNIAEVEITFLGPVKGASNVELNEKPEKIVENTNTESAYYLQFGAFQSHENAQNLKAKIPQTHIKSKGGLYLVLSKPYATKEAALRAKTERVEGTSHIVFDAF